MIKVLLLADTHLGFDLPSRPRVDRRRRGPDFFACTRRALEPALAGEVDLVVHGGDLLFRSKVRPGLVAQALEPLLELAADGQPGGRVVGHAFHELPARPMCVASVDASGLAPAELQHGIREKLGVLPTDAVVSLWIEGELSPGSQRVLRAEALRALHPPSMSVEIRLRSPARR